MTHGNTVIYSYSIEFCSEAAEFLDPCLDLLTDLVEMHMSWDKLSKGVDDCNDRFAELAILHSIGPPESSSSGHFRADCTLTASEFFHSKKISSATITQWRCRRLILITHQWTHIFTFQSPETQQ